MSKRFEQAETPKEIEHAVVSRARELTNELRQLDSQLLTGEERTVLDALENRLATKEEGNNRSEERLLSTLSTEQKTAYDGILESFKEGQMWQAVNELEKAEIPEALVTTRMFREAAIRGLGLFAGMTKHPGDVEEIIEELQLPKSVTESPLFVQNLQRGKRMKG